MPVDDTNGKSLWVGLTANIVGAYVTKNPVSAADLAPLIVTVHEALRRLVETLPKETERPSVPAISVRKSVSPDAITCLDCGKRFKSLKRHLMAAHGLTPTRYREKWSLALDYPMVAPTYSHVRSESAKRSGLGTRTPRKSRS